MKYKIMIITAVVAAFAASAKACTLEQLNEKMPNFIAHNMKAGQGFKQLLDDAIALRIDCAKRTPGENPEEYGIAVKSYKPLFECEDAFNSIKGSNEILKNEKIVRFSTLFSTSNLFSKGTDHYQAWFLKAFQNLYGINVNELSVVGQQRDMNSIRDAMISRSLGNKEPSIVEKQLDAKNIERISALDIIPEDVLFRGTLEMKKHKVVIAGISRDNGPQLPIMKKYIEFIAEHFLDYRVVIFENDSKDGSKAFLSNWQNQNSKIVILSENFNIQKRPSIQFLAFCRNKYIQEIMKTQYNDFDICMFVDMDMGYGFDIRGIKDSFSKIEDWDGVFANGISSKAGDMYDAFAFRNSEFPYVPHLTPTYWKKEVKEIQKIYPVGSALVPVDSAFGGLGIYKRTAIVNCFYDAPNNDCEHVAFHKQARENNGSRLFMNPNMVVRYIHYK